MNSAVSSDSFHTEFSDQSRSKLLVRIFGQMLVATVLLYLFSRYLIYWQDWPSLSESIQSLIGSSEENQESPKLFKGIALLLGYLAVFVFVVIRVSKKPNTSLTNDSDTYRNLSFYIIRAAFWAVFLVGIADTAISLLRVENFLETLMEANLPMQWG